MNESFDLLTPARCCLMVIDPQERLMVAIHKAERVVRNTRLLIHCARAVGMAIVATTQYRKGLGPFVPELAELLQGEPCADKTEFNAMANPAVQQMLTRLPPAVDTFILAGAETHICIYQTAMGIRQAGLTPWIVADAISSRHERNAELALDRMRSLGMAVGPTEMAVYELLYRAGTPAFKAMLPHLK
ncbi:MAG: hypothetical protein A2521_14715 [Deltaproteobacteria bacterium RIFOXYD12_FULL_57_12]|nr:MAG: hypothetical protein A2521_14715 [Deltaproteobacteria bacterium RIFOXYD12_FULL_57_12]